MKLTLNYAILKFLTQKKHISVYDIMDGLSFSYSSHKLFKKHLISEILMAAKENGLINEDGYELINDELIIYYSTDEKQKEMINKYLG